MPTPDIRSPEIYGPLVVRATSTLNTAGVRIIVMADGSVAIGVWSDLDSAEIRTALRAVAMDAMPLVYLDGAEAPPRYKVRRVPGDVVPVAVLRAMEGHAAPWTVRDRMLRDMQWPKLPHRR